MFWTFRIKVFWIILWTFTTRNRTCFTCPSYLLQRWRIAVKVQEGRRVTVVAHGMCTTGWVICKGIVWGITIYFLMNQKTVNLSNNVLVLPNLANIFYFFQNFLQILCWGDFNLLYGKHSAVKLIFSFKHLPKITWNINTNIFVSSKYCTLADCL